ncbi:hypothetical protein M422DRAFT_267151 [Sphaerobolus stellatus SS14]|uniref:Ubiquitin-like protease family profile domain-containing protein n=1 Tax=Sphaerobolus stellatus (strain SS14) TaxID=990650 RepID=A0A0C9V0R3_SPHS4|nr:hypothetical protein M422DRAFT_267151 [Sphaerobolus stellatus SS14]
MIRCSIGSITQRSVIKDIPQDRRYMIHCFSSIFWINIIKHGYQNEITIKECKEINLFLCEVIVLPVNNNGHWYLILVCHPEYLLQTETGEVADCDTLLMVWDSFEIERENIAKDVMEFLVNHAREVGVELRPDAQCDLFHVPTPLQENTYDCGPFVTYFFRSFVNDLSKFIAGMNDELEPDEYKKVYIPPINPAKIREDVQKAVLSRSQAALRLVEKA